MYIPVSFNQENFAEIKALIKYYPLGLLITSGPGGLLASPLPFLLKEAAEPYRLVAHMAKANLHWQDLASVRDCLVVFQGVDNYITPSWYSSKAETHKVVPTWNYEMVQVRGIPRVIEDTVWLRKQIEELTNLMEEQRVLPWKVSDAPADFITAQLSSIIGIEIAVTDIQAKYKMSQNKSAQDLQGVVEGLSIVDDPHSNLTMAQLILNRMQNNSDG